MDYQQIEAKFMLPADKANHVVVLGLPAGILGAALAAHFGFDAKMGAIGAAFVAGVAKELMDKVRGGDVSAADVAFTTGGGGAIAAGLWAVSLS